MLRYATLDPNRNQPCSIHPEMHFSYSNLHTSIICIFIP